jgi:hypothetical protein
MIQLTFFPEDEVHELRKELVKVKTSNEKVRRAMFARHGELAKMYTDLLDRLEIIERNICKPKVTTLDFSSDERSLSLF